MTRKIYWQNLEEKIETCCFCIFYLHFSASLYVNHSKTFLLWTQVNKYDILIISQSEGWYPQVRPGRYTILIWYPHSHEIHSLRRMRLFAGKTTSTFCFCSVTKKLMHCILFGYIKFVYKLLSEDTIWMIVSLPFSSNFFFYTGDMNWSLIMSTNKNIVFWVTRNSTSLTGSKWKILRQSYMQACSCNDSRCVLPIYNAHQIKMIIDWVAMPAAGSRHYLNLDTWILHKTSLVNIHVWSYLLYQETFF